MAKPLPATEDTAEEAHALPTLPTKQFLSSSAGVLAGFFNRITHGMAPNVAFMCEHHGEDDLQVAFSPFFYLIFVTGKKRGREQGEKGSEDDDTNGDDKAKDIHMLRPKYSQVRKCRKWVDFEREQLISLGARSGYSADMDCDSDIMEVDGDAMEEDSGYVQVMSTSSGTGTSSTDKAMNDMQDSPRVESEKGSIPGADD
ncbi:hypothetical protein F5141DRAFT_1211922 [Pisolithus sp. B1]|nr:hypothetical protein F5141DRAFT_1211922 [Pisolithus sp. B1]